MSRSQEQLAAGRVATKRVWIYVAVGLGLAIGGVVLPFASWRSTIELHTVLETVATTLALVIAAAAPCRYYSHEDNKFLFIGTGFFATALLDGYHTIVTSMAFQDYSPSLPASLSASSWLTSRAFLATLMIVSWWASQRKRKWRLRTSRVYALMALLSASIFGFFAIVPLAAPRPLGTFIGHPEEFLIAVAFLVALVGFLYSGNWRHDDFSHWLVLALIVNVGCQTVAMPRSFHPHDVMFDVAHLLKVAGYGCVLVGILVSTYQLHANVEEGVRRLLESEERFQLAVRGTADGLWDWEISSNTVWYSPRLRELLGYRGDDEEAFPPRLETFNLHLHPEDQKRAAAAVKQHLAHDYPYDIEYRLRTKTGQWRWFRARGACVRDHDGVATRMAGSISDIQELYEVNSRLASEQFLLESLVDNIPDPIFFKDRDSRFIRVNRTMARDVGADDPADLIGKTDAEVWAGEFWVDTYADEQRLMTTGVPLINKEERPRTKDGRQRWVLVTKMPIYDASHKIVGLFGIARDITELKRNEQERERTNRELERSNAELEHFAYVASHDLRSPLRNIESLTQWIIEDAGDVLPEASRHDLMLLRQRVDLMNRLLNDLLQYSRVGRIESDPEDIDPVAIVAEVIELLAVPPAFRIDVPPQMPHVYAPRTAVRKVFQNLIDNAIKHHDRPDGVIGIRAIERDGLVQFAVQDDGPGIAPQFHHKVFEIFQTLQSRDELDTSGMGLAIVKKTVDKYGGQIQLSSEVGQGATFTFTWPQTPVDRDPTIETGEPERD